METEANDSFGIKNISPIQDSYDLQVTSPDLAGISFMANNSGLNNKPKSTDTSMGILKKNAGTLELVRYLAMSEYKYRTDTTKLQQTLVKHNNNVLIICTINFEEKYC